MSENKLQEFGYQITGADSHVKSRKERLAQTPKTDVIWSGKPGVSRAYPEDPGSQTLLATYGRSCVSYDRTGEPDFSFCAEASIKISDMCGERSRNFSSAGKKLLNTKWAEDRGITNLSQLEQYRKDHELTWHERSDGITMDLIPSKINSRFGHSGGVSELSAVQKQIDLKHDGLLRTAGKATGVAGIYARQTGVIISESIKPAIEAGESAALVAFTVSGLNNITMVASGQKKAKDAIKDVITDTTASFGSAAGIEMTQEITVRFAQKLSAEQIANFATQQLPVSEIALAAMIFTAIKNYLDGSISAEDCAFQLIANGAGTIAYQLGATLTAGCPVGGIIASWVMAHVTSAIMKYRQEQKIQIARAAEIDHLLSCAKAEIARQQDYVKDYFVAEKKRWDDTIDNGFAVILSSALKQDSNGITNGLNMILSLFGKQVLFPTTESFVQALYSDEPIIL